MSARRGLSPGRHNLTVARAAKPAQRGLVISIGIIAVVMVIAVAATFASAQGDDIRNATQNFLLFYAGVLTLIALTTAVGVGIVASDRIVMVPAHRVVAQAVHRAVSISALAFLIVHITLEIIAQRVSAISAVIPFLAAGRTFYIGLGTISSDLLVLLIVTGLLRARFAGRAPWTWRAIHATAYVCWPLSIWHGLLAGRAAKPYVDWSYGGCLAAVALALVIRFVATLRSNEEKAAHPVPDRASSPIHAALPAMAQEGTHSQIPGGWPAAPVAGGWQGGQVPGGWQAPRALHGGTGGGGGSQADSYPAYPRSPYSHPYQNSVPYLEAHRPAEQPEPPGQYWEQERPGHSPYTPHGTEDA